MQAPTGTSPRRRSRTSATCSKLPPSENSDPAVFSIRMVRPPCQGRALAWTRQWRPRCAAVLARGRRRETSGMQDQIFRAQRKGALDLAPKRFHRFLQKKLIRTGQVHQVIRVNHLWLQIRNGSAAGSFQRTATRPVHTGPIAASWKRKPGTCCNPGDTLVRRRYALLQRRRCECQYGGMLGGAGDWASAA